MSMCVEWVTKAHTTKSLAKKPHTTKANTDKNPHRQKPIQTKADTDKSSHRQKPTQTKAHTDKSPHIQQKSYFRNINKAH